MKKFIYLLIAVISAFGIMLAATCSPNKDSSGESSYSSSQSGASTATDSLSGSQTPDSSNGGGSSGSESSGGNQSGDNGSADIGQRESNETPRVPLN